MMGSRTSSPARTSAAPSRRRGAMLPSAVLVASGGLGARLPAERAVDALATGLRAGGRTDIDRCPIPAGETRGAGLDALLASVDFDARLRAARALVIGAHELSERTLAGSVAFELATRARQGGVPAYAVTREDGLGAFGARLLDLQVLLGARSAAELERAGSTLAALL